MDKEKNPWRAAVREIAAKSAPADHQGEILFYGASNFYLWKDMPADLAPYRVLNHGFGGSVDPDLALFADELLYPYAPRIVFLQTGSNDYVMRSGTDQEKVSACMAYKKEMLGQFMARLPGADFVLMSGLHLPGRSHFREMTTEINRQLRALSDETERLYFVNADALTWNGEAYAASLFLEDMIHLNREGQLAWARGYILPMIRRLAEKA